METRLEATATSTDEVRPGPWIALKDICWWIYLHPVRWVARRMPSRLRRPHPILFALSHALTRAERDRVRAWLGRLDPGLLSRTPEAIARENVERAVQRILDDLIIDELVGDRSLPVVIRGREHLERALRDHSGAMLMSGHFFGSRLAKRVLAREGFPVMSVRHFAPPDASLGRFRGRELQAEYIRFLHDVIVDEVDIHDPACTMKILQRLRQGGLVHVHIDTLFAEQRTDLQFLGETRPFALGFLRIAEVAGCALIPTRFLGDSSKVEVTFEAPVSPVAGQRHDETLRAIVADLERHILEYPEQWEIWLRA